MSLINELRSRIQYKIIVPFMVLTLLVALAGSSVALLIITGSAQERLNNQIAQTARDASDLVVAVERANLAFLREVAFAAPNPYTGAPAVAAALRDGDVASLELALTPYFEIGSERGVRVDRLLVFDHTGQSLFDREHSTRDASQHTSFAHPSENYASLWFVRDVLAGSADPLGDKYAGLVELDNVPYFYTVVPIVDDASHKVVGGAIAAISMPTLLREIAIRSQVAFVSVHDASSGIAFASTLVASEDLEALQARPELLNTLRTFETIRQDQGVFETVQVNMRSYQLAFAPLRIRGAMVGIFSVALASDYVVTPWAEMRLPLFGIASGLMVAIIGLGIRVARSITRPLNELVGTAEAVIGGDLARRSVVTTGDEIGTLATSFNAMTGHLLELYQAVRVEASHRAAIFESIADGIAVISLNGEIVLVNSALRSFLQIGANDALPARLADIPLQPLGSSALNFGGQTTPDLFHLHNRVVRVNTSTISSDDNQPLGYVYVFQDMTREVAIDRAKTDFIATISHELRTPLTVIGGNTDLLLSGLVGAVDAEQRPLLESIRRYTRTTTTLINNIITVASLDAGTVAFEPEPVDLVQVLDEVIPPFRKTAKAKGLEIVVELPQHLPEVLAERTQLPLVFRQLLDNACRYSVHGRITVSASVVPDGLRVDVSDDGPGIEPWLQAQLFTRFMRGSDGINSSERGLGLGLAIARELIEQQGGRLWLAMTSIHGSTFSFVLPSASVQLHHTSEEALAYA